MKISYNWLQGLVNKKLPSPGKLAELLTNHSFEVEEVSRAGGDWVLDIDVLPNRAGDCLSHIGIARECAALSGSKLKVKNPKLSSKAKAPKPEDLIQIEVKDKNDCSRYTAAIISGVKVKSSPKRIQEKLRVLGLQPINNVVDILNYVMLETGQPLHAFDLDKVSGAKIQNSKFKTITVRRARKGEKIETLDERIYKLDSDILLIADKEGPLAVAGIKGGKRAEIDSKTKNIVIEAANFNPTIIRQASKRLKLRTDASWRFENGIDPNLIDFAQKRVVSLIGEIAGGKAAQGIIDFYPKKVRPQKIKLELNYVESLLGVKIPLKEIKKILKNLGFTLHVTGYTIIVEAPTRRLDIKIPEDLIEEVGRIYGFRNIPSVFPKMAVVPPERNEDIFWARMAREILKEAGFSEVYNYSFIGEREKEVFGLDSEELIELENPISSFNKYLRPSLIVNLLKNAKENSKRFPELKIFEIGEIFSRKGKVREKKMLSGVLTRKRMGNEGFYELKGTVDYLFSKLGVGNVWYDDYRGTREESKIDIWHAKKSAEIKSDGEEIGFLGEIHPRIIEKLGVADKVFVFDLNFEKLRKLVSEEHEYQPISAYPASVRDLAILVPRGTKVVEVLNKINQAGGELVRDVDLFDFYEGEGIPEGKTNFAFHIVYQAEDRTLRSEEVDKIHQRIIEVLEENPEWEARK